VAAIAERWSLGRIARLMRKKIIIAAALVLPLLAVLLLWPFSAYDVSRVHPSNCDPAIIPFLDAPVGSAFGRVPDTGRFEQEGFVGGENDDA